MQEYNPHISKIGYRDGNKKSNISSLVYRFRNRNYLVYVCSRNADFTLYAYAINREHDSLFFCIRSLPLCEVDVYSFDMKMLFIKYGPWAILQAKNSFSTIRLDHCHEQHNKDLKVDWEILRLTGDDVKHLRWMVYDSCKTPEMNGLWFRSGTFCLWHCASISFERKKNS